MKSRIATILLLLTLAACDKGSSDAPAPRRIEATVAASHTASTRTALGEVGDGTAESEQPIVWQRGDAIRIWAFDDAGAASLAPTEFAFRAFDRTYSSAEFTATIPEMAEGDHTYYCVYPAATAVAGTAATFTLPAEQNGAWDGSCDLMAGSCTGAALTDRSTSPSLRLSMRHLCHLLRIEIPDGRNLLGAPVKRLEITFPTEVVGTASFDVRDPEGTMQWSDLSDKVVLTFDDEALLDADATTPRYAWVYVKPGTELRGAVSFRAYTAANVPSKAVSTSVDRTLEAQRITPIRLTVPEALDPIVVRFTCPDNDTYPNFLGEEATRLIVKEWPAGILSAEGGDIVVENGVGTARFYYEAGEVNTELPGAVMTVAFESEHADLNGTEYAITLPTDLTVAAPEAHYALPYLFFEDFSETESFEYNTEHKTSDANNPSPIALDQYGLIGWTGTRCGSSTGIGLRIASRCEIGVYIKADYDGRIDSAPIANLKEAAAASVSGIYNYAGARYNGTGGSDGSPVVSFGYTTASGIIALSTDIETSIFNERAIDVDEEGNQIFYGNTPHNESFLIPQCTKSTRLSWKITNNHSRAFAANGMYWLYLDDIKVSVGSVVKHTDLNYRAYFN